MLFEELNKLVDTEKEAIEFALQWKLLPEKHVICPVCNIGNVGWYKRSHEGLKIPYALRCSRKKCRKKWSVTKNTWFFGSHLSVKQNILLIYCWIKGDTVGETSEILKLSKSTVMDYYQFCREVCYTIVSNRTKPIGGPNEIVSLCNYQIDRFIDKQKRIVSFLEGVNQDNFSDYSKISDGENDFAEKYNIKIVKSLNDSVAAVSTPKKCLWRTGKKFSEDEENKTRDFVMFQYLYFHPIESLSIGEKFKRFLRDVAKVYPGPFKISLTPVIY
ncbi:hypothetical protein Phum_PHUM513150 [Pediculus humanus corporis]|uniref:Uncharacterized protein n=1 Tax=Pediculus humanus subsp. corporis TaxID=121224 RepID=E0VYD6_PEDHC|nr:uncharacterized protein Phum_PHUM513150 [Pediculus humanus corporis]EEB18392.1 hypothetical protein Phum_PHUM513150 [Pediculus humanus corporis]